MGIDNLGKEMIDTASEIRKSQKLQTKEISKTVNLYKEWRKGLTGVLIDLHWLRILGANSKILAMNTQMLGKAFGYLIDMALLPLVPAMVQFTKYVIGVAKWIRQLPQPARLLVAGLAALAIGVTTLGTILMYATSALTAFSAAVTAATAAETAKAGQTTLGMFGAFGAAGVAGVGAGLGMGYLNDKWLGSGPKANLNRFALISNMYYKNRQKGIQIPYLAEGGVATKPTAGIFGEAGAEAIIPLSKIGEVMGNILGAGAGFANTLTQAAMGGGGVGGGLNLPGKGGGGDVAAKGFTWVAMSINQGFKVNHELLAAILALLAQFMGVKGGEPPKDPNQSLIETILTIPQLLVTAFTTAMSVAWTAFTSAVTSAWNTVISLGTTTWNTILETATNVWGTIHSAWTNLTDTISTGFTSIINSALTIPQLLVTAFTTAMSVAWTAFTSAVTSAWNTVISLGTTTWNTILETATNVWNTINSAWSNLTNTISTGFTNIINSAHAGLDQFFSSADQAWQDLIKLAQSFIPGRPEGEIVPTPTPTGPEGVGGGGGGTPIFEGLQKVFQNGVYIGDWELYSDGTKKWRPNPNISGLAGTTAPPTGAGTVSPGQASAGGASAYGAYITEGADNYAKTINTALQQSSNIVTTIVPESTTSFTDVFVDAITAVGSVIWNTVTDAAESVASGITNAVSAAGDVLNTVSSYLSGTPGFRDSTTSTAMTGGFTAGNAVNALGLGSGSLSGIASRIVQGAVTTAGGAAAHTLGIPGFASGGTMPYSGLAFLHEGETVVPAGVDSGAGGITINNPTFMVSGRTERELFESFMRLMKTEGARVH